MSKPVERPAESRPAGAEPQRTISVRQLLERLKTLFPRRAESAPTQAEEPAEEPREKNKVSTGYPNGRSGGLYLQVERRKNGRLIGNYQLPFPGLDRTRGVATSYGQIQLNDPNQPSATGHAREMLREVLTVLRAVSKRLNRPILWTEDGVHPHPAEILTKKPLEFSPRKNVLAGGNYFRDIKPSEGHPELTEEQESAVQAILEHLGPNARRR